MKSNCLQAVMLFNFFSLTFLKSSALIISVHTKHGGKNLPGLSYPGSWTWKKAFEKSFVFFKKVQCCHVAQQLFYLLCSLTKIFCLRIGEIIIPLVSLKDVWPKVPLLLLREKSICVKQCMPIPFRFKGQY